MTRLLTTSAALAVIAGAAQAEFTLHVLHYNDVHSRIEPISRFDSTCGAEDDAAGECFGGAARLKAAIDTKRAELEGENVVVLDAGDQLQGSLMFTTYDGDAEAEMMNAIAPDVFALGNHEFNKGPGNLARVIGLLDGIPVVSGNLDLTSSDELGDLVQDTVTLDVNGTQVGIVSALATDTAETSSPGDDVVFMDEVESLQQDVAELTDAGVDVIIGLTHVGFAADRRIAEAVGGLDAIVGGHSHTVFGEDGEAYPTMVEGVPVVQAGAYGKYLGHLTLTFDDDGNLTDSSGEVMLLDASVKPDPEVAQRVAELAEPIAELQERVVAESAVAIEGDRSVCRQEECPMGNLVTDAMLDRVSGQGVQIAFTNAGGIRASIDEGEVTMGEVFTVLPFQNTLSTFEVTGATLVEALENGVSEHEEIAGRFPQVAGMSFSFDASQPVGERVSDVMVGGEPIDAQATYMVVSNNYVRNGGDGYAMFEDAANAYDYGPDLADVLAEYMAANAPVAPETEGRITRVDG